MEQTGNITIMDCKKRNQTILQALVLAIRTNNANEKARLEEIIFSVGREQREFWNEIALCTSSQRPDLREDAAEVRRSCPVIFMEM